MSATLQVAELFLSVQGESSFAGRPCSFVRLAGCPLRCRWCDTADTRDESAGVTWGLDEVVAAALEPGVQLVEVTGGEPLAQPATPRLLTALCDHGREILLETSGAFDLAPVDRRVRVIMDVKCPDSGMTDRMLWSNLERLPEGAEVKFVLASRGDYDFARELIRDHRLDERGEALLSVASGRLDPVEVVEWMLADRLEARFQLQLHKLLWSPDARGV